LFAADDNQEASLTMTPRERQIEKLKQEIRNLEEQIVSEKPWQLQGETTNRDRPLNSLLAENLDFQQATKKAPIITQELTSTVEEMIQKRIKEKAFDDVIRKTVVEKRFKPKIVLDSEKSNIGLGELYEKEYLEKNNCNSKRRESQPKT